MSGAGSMSSKKMGLINGICGILCDTGFIDWLGYGVWVGLMGFVVFCVTLVSLIGWGMRGVGGVVVCSVHCGLRW